MIPAEFDYVVATSVGDAIAKIAEGGEDAKFIAGGHSLLPLMKLRLAAPTLLVDLGRLDVLRGVRRENGWVRIGAMTTHHAVATAGLGLVSDAAATIADQQVRNRGTIGGSIAHGDPVSDMPAVMLAVEAFIVVQGPAAVRQIAAADFFRDYLTTDLAPDEVLTEIRFPDATGWRHGYQKFNRRQEDWAMVAVSALVRDAGGTAADVRIGLTHMGSTPLRATAAEEVLRGQPLTAESIAAAAERAADGTSPPGDLNASPDYKRHLARVLTRRALQQAAGVA